MLKHERPRPEVGGAVEDQWHDHSTASAAPIQDPEAPGHPPGAAEPVPVHDKLRWTWDDVEALTGMSKRWMQREISAGRMPSPDLRMGRRAGWRPSTIATYLDELADRQRRSSR